MSKDKTPIFFTSLEDLKDDLDLEKEAGRRILELPNSDLNQGEQWFSEDYEGQLSVDVFQTSDKLVVKSTIAGVKPEDLEVFLHNDLLTIRGKREKEFEESDAEYLFKECYWGGFSRSIILPFEVKADEIMATYKNGVLTVILPKAIKSKSIAVHVEQD